MLCVAVSILTVAQDVQTAMLVFVAMGIAFLLAIFLALLYYRKHKVSLLLHITFRLGTWQQRCSTATHRQSKA
jgi:hypothetical protein